MWLYLATDLTATTQRLEEDEVIEIVRLPVERALQMISDGEIEDAKTIIGLLLAAPRLGAAGGWMGKPLDLVKCETIDVAVPATSEIVIEGELLPGERRVEGPFGEFPGYYQGTMEQPVFRVRQSRTGAIRFM